LEQDIMAKGVNKVLLLGNVGKDPEIRSTAGGMTVASFSLATADRAKDAQGNWVDKTEWHNLVCFQRTAEVVRDYVKKGTQLFVEGKIQTRSWDDKTSGEKKYKTEILVNELTLLGSKGGGESSGSGGGYSKSNTASYGSNAPASSQPDYADTGITDDDIPFSTSSPHKTDMPTESLVGISVYPADANAKRPTPHEVPPARRQGVLRRKRSNDEPLTIP
jgi:single-strand DNA-binding protein